MYGLFIGDIAGSVREFNVDKLPSCGIFIKLSLDTVGITDDSILAIATIRAIVNSNYNPTDIDFINEYHSMSNKFPYPIGAYGEGFKKWSRVPIDKKQPYYSCGNGSAMRVGPVGYLARTVEECIEWADMSARCTHSHPEGIKGAIAVALWVFYGKAGIKNPIEHVKNVHNISYEPIDQLPYFDSTCQDTLRLATHILNNTTSFESAVHKAVTTPNADSDTLGAIVGAVAEAMYGIPDTIKNEMFEYIHYKYKKYVYESINVLYGSQLTYELDFTGFNEQST